MNLKRYHIRQLSRTLTVFLLFCICMANHIALASERSSDFDEALYQRLIKANDRSTDRFLSGDIQYANPRFLSFQFGVLTASYCAEGSKYFDSETVLQQLTKILELLLEAQRPNGTIDAGGNKQSPPDTAFLIDNLGPAAKVLAARNSKESLILKKRLDRFMLQAGEALVTGGVHTPNHRWVISSALGQLYEIYGDYRYLTRIEDWLAEGIFIDQDGQFPERSRIYSEVVDQALISIAESLDREELLEPVRKNLLTTYYLMEDNGDLVSLESRRQDQNMKISVGNYYWCYRYMALKTGDLFFGAVAQRIEQLPNFDPDVLSFSLIHFLATPEIQNRITSAEKLSDKYEKYFPQSDLARIKTGDRSLTIFGGNDLPLTVSSGRSCNPSFFSFRKGSAILEYVRLSTSFFNTGYFRSEGLTQDGNKYKLQENKEGYYYQPLAAANRNSEGDYQLGQSPDRRYWSKMDFGNRELSNVQRLETAIELFEHDGEVQMMVTVSGVSDVDVTLDFCFNSEGELSNVVPAANDQEFFLKQGYAIYKSGDDTITVGPGCFEHAQTEKIDGEVYSTHFGSIKGKGLHLYLTGKTPFSHTIRIN